MILPSNSERVPNPKIKLLPRRCQSQLIIVKTQTPRIVAFFQFSHLQVYHYYFLQDYFLLHNDQAQLDTVNIRFLNLLNSVVARTQKQIHIQQRLFCNQFVSFYSPDESLISFFAISSATKEVATLRRGILNSFDTILKIDIETPAEANSTEPTEATKRIQSINIIRKQNKAHFQKHVCWSIQPKAFQILIDV